MILGVLACSAPHHSGTDQSLPGNDHGDYGDDYYKDSNDGGTQGIICKYSNDNDDKRLFTNYVSGPRVGGEGFKNNDNG